MPQTPPRNTCSLNDLRDLETVLDRSGGEPVGILTESRRIGHFVPQEWVDKHRITTEDALIETLRQHTP